MELKLRRAILILTALAVVTAFGLWRSGLTGLWTQGISYIANNTQEFSDKEGYPVDGTFSLSINLSDLKSNIGKELYNDGKHRVYVYFADKVNSNEGGYRIGFRSSGTYSLSGASLISGLHHRTLDDHSFTTEMTAQMTVQYEGKSYTGSNIGESGLNYKDGDDFLIYMPPLDTQGEDEAALEEPGIVQIYITDLYMNRWTKI